MVDTQQFLSTLIEGISSYNQVVIISGTAGQSCDNTGTSPDGNTTSLIIYVNSTTTDAVDENFTKLLNEKLKNREKIGEFKVGEGCNFRVFDLRS